MCVWLNRCKDWRIRMNIWIGESKNLLIRWWMGEWIDIYMLIDG